MTIVQIAWTLLALEGLVFLASLYTVFFPRSGADAAGRGLNQAYTFAFGIYLALNLALMLPRPVWCTVIAIVMASIPLAVGGYGMLRWLRMRGDRF